MPTQEPLISIALCTYNGEEFLPEQIDSILAQTYKNLEIVIVDDCSTDKTIGIINSYSEKDKRIKLFQNETNLGFNKNFEKALSLTSGEYISISDQDDIWLPEKLQRLLTNIKNNWLIFSNSSYLGDLKQGRLLNKFKLPKNYKGILLRNHVTGHTSLMHRDFLNFVLPFPQLGYYDWWMGFVASYYNQIAFLDEVLTLYRVHSGSVVQSRLGAGNIKKQEFENTLKMLEAFSEYKNLKPEDKIFISQLKDAYELRGSESQSLPLEKIIANNYRELFPNRKPWKVLTKHIFARKFSRGI
ncbi:MAG: glycosyltransferase family 2 protein [Bacteroidetes bacterium]|jgi:glycosyltransferase involved in cell wall biosynthesis|nr:glycosyltransferase family 2 protein [Bacteroidota bacterium]